MPMRFCAALEDLKKLPTRGLIKTYARPFSSDNHDALGPGRLHYGAL